MQPRSSGNHAWIQIFDHPTPYWSQAIWHKLLTWTEGVSMHHSFMPQSRITGIFLSALFSCFSRQPLGIKSIMQCNRADCDFQTNVYIHRELILIISWMLTLLYMVFSLLVFLLLLSLSKKPCFLNFKILLNKRLIYLSFFLVTGEAKGKVQLESRNRLNIYNMVGKSPEFCFIRHEKGKSKHFIKGHQRFW